MPYKQVFEPAAVFLEHNGMKVYHVYKNDELRNGPLKYWFSLYEDGREEGEDRPLGIFYICDLPGFDGNKSVEDVLKEAIEDGTLKSPGIEPKIRTQVTQAYDVDVMQQKLEALGWKFGTPAEIGKEEKDEGTRYKYGAVKESTVLLFGAKIDEEARKDCIEDVRRMEYRRMKDTDMAGELQVKETYTEVIEVPFNYHAKTDKHISEVLDLSSDERNEKLGITPLLYSDKTAAYKWRDGMLAEVTYNPSSEERRNAAVLAVNDLYRQMTEPYKPAEKAHRSMILSHMEDKNSTPLPFMSLIDTEHKTITRTIEIKFQDFFGKTIDDATQHIELAVERAERDFVPVDYLEFIDLNDYKFISCDSSRGVIWVEWESDVSRLMEHLELAATEGTVEYYEAGNAKIGKESK